MRTHKNARVLRALFVAKSTVAQWGLVGTTLMLLVLLTVGASQACQFESNLISPTARSAAQIVTQRSTIGSAVTQFAIMNASVGSLGADHCDSLCCAGTCCAACSAGIIVESWIPTRGSLQCINIPFGHTPLPSTESDAVFRPPRLFV
jgi:hypothetical protein